MKHFLSINDLPSLSKALQEIQSLKSNPNRFRSIGTGHTLIMLFFNASLRTRLSTEKAARLLGMDVITLNISEAWKLEFDLGSVMNLDTSEHVIEAARVLSQYGSILAIRAFPNLENKARDKSEWVLRNFVKYATIPVVNLESATGHPLQALSDAVTIEENKNRIKPKVVLSWAPHPKALPHAVSNSFIRCMQLLEVDLTITHPEGYELDPEITKNVPIEYNQKLALEDADFVYVKNWSSYSSYGKVLSKDPAWMMTLDKLGKGKLMHCLPVRRNVVVEDAVLDSDSSLVIQQAKNRIFAAQLILKSLIENC